MKQSFYYVYKVESTYILYDNRAGSSDNRNLVGKFLDGLIIGTIFDMINLWS
jgi:hypothetical protein